MFLNSQNSERQVFGDAPRVRVRAVRQEKSNHAGARVLHVLYSRAAAGRS